jgi:hypothetical protein
MNKLLAILVVLTMTIVTASVALADPTAGEDDGCCPQGCEYDCGLEATYPNDATQIGTTVNILGGGGTGGSTGDVSPIVKCKWEYDLDVEVDMGECAQCVACVDGSCIDSMNMFYHDACPCIDGLQVKPILGGSVKVGYYAIVTDPQGVSQVSTVYADVWHPDGQFKYQIELHPVGFDSADYDKTVALGLWDHVQSCHSDLVTINTAWEATLPVDVTAEDDILDELNEQLAYLYYGEAYISYCQPGGEYLVGVRAVDITNAWSAWLYNTFWYIPTSAVEVDFEQVNYGDVAVCTEKWVGGDALMTTPNKPTVKNIGNTPVELYVWQDDMGFSDTSGEWNVMFDARLTADGEEVYYYPYEFDGDETPDDTSDDYPGVRIPGVIDLCTQEKLDFSIHAFKGQPVVYTGVMRLYACINGLPAWVTPIQHVGTAQTGIPQNNMP